MIDITQLVFAQFATVLLISATAVVVWKKSRKIGVEFSTGFFCQRSIMDATTSRIFVISINFRLYRSCDDFVPVCGADD